MAPDVTGFDAPITTKACLECALERGVPPCGFDYTLLKYIYSHKRYRALDIHVSDLLTCPRRAWYDKQMEYPTTASSKLIVTLGTLQHKLLEEMEDEHYKAELIVDADGVVGTTDAYYNDGRIVDYKTTRNMNTKYLPQKKHIMQVNMYAHALRQMGHPVTSAQIQYIDLLGATKCRCKAFAVPGPKGKAICPQGHGPIPNGHLGGYLAKVPLWDEEKTGEVYNERKDYLVENLENGSIPEQVEPDFLCLYCPFLQMCDEGQTEVARRTRR
jgi:CRISPR/Cas system-associated exonuclease Cas4 (RecB family)